ncbi:helix-turn-helix domain-containing protein [Prevotella sp. P6B4]|uniref:helix-turn-helix domain-containing protein n=1 Tax=Prevotella sp. P6B4 TaxID=1410614 RepID=UPI000490A75A|nr:helix-turn-helix domain-containing protein [Prevotella sp. P6B4]
MTRKTYILLTIILLSVLTAGAVNVSPRIFRNYTSANGLADNSAQTIHCTKTGRLVITTIGQINFFDGAAFTYIDPLEENIYALSEYQGNYHLYFDRFHHIWLKNTHSVTCVDLLTERFTKSIEDEFRQFGVTERVKDLFVDSTGIVWLLIDKGLFNVKTKKIIKLREQFNLQDLEVYKNQYVMLFYDNGLMEMYDQESGKKLIENRAYTDKDNVRYNQSSLVKVDGSNVYQIRNGNKEAILMKYDVNLNEWSELMRTPYHMNNMAIRDSLLYVPCEYGYWIYNVKTHEADHVEAVVLESGQTLVTDVNVITFDRQGGMWVGTEKRGLLYSKPYKSPFMVYKWGDSKANHYGAMMNHRVDEWPMFRSRMVNCVYKDSRGWTWVGTAQGLQLYRRENDLLPQVYTMKDGLYNNIVHSIVEDLNHNIWVATSYGISVVLFREDGRVHFINSYNQYDHVPNEVFVNGKAMCLPDGHIVMQSLDHVIEFDPGQMTTLGGDYPFEIYPKLIKLMVNGVDVDPTTEIDGKRILDRALSRVWGLDLNYNQNSLTLVFSALNYFRPQQTFYRVRVRGLDDEWRVLTPYSSDGMVDKQGLLHLPLMALRPGSYVLEVQASLVPDKWTTRAYEWEINVHEPWWRTTGVFMLLAGVILILFFINLFYYMKNTNLRAMRNSEETGLIKRIYNFIDRCSTSGDVLEPSPEEYSQADPDLQNELAPEFVTVIEKIMPVVRAEKKKKKITMRKLSGAAGIDVKEFYALITANIFKSPRQLIKKSRLAEAEHMLRTTKEPIDSIAEKCGFVSANYFIASFFQAHHITPEAYRQRR